MKIRNVPRDWKCICGLRITLIGLRETPLQNADCQGMMILTRKPFVSGWRGSHLYQWKDSMAMECWIFEIKKESGLGASYRCAWTSHKAPSAPRHLSQTINSRADASLPWEKGPHQWSQSSNSKRERRKKWIAFPVPSTYPDHLPAVPWIPCSLSGISLGKRRFMVGLV